MVHGRRHAKLPACRTSSFMTCVGRPLGTCGASACPQVVRMRITGHRTDSMERRYNIVDIEDIKSAKELMQRKTRHDEEPKRWSLLPTTLRPAPALCCLEQRSRPA